MGSLVRSPPVGAAMRPPAGADPSWHLPPTSSSRHGRGQGSPASSNGPNGRAEPLAEKRGAEPGAGAHLRTRLPAPRRLPAGSRPRPRRRPRPSPGGHVTIPVAGGALTVTAPESGGEAPLAVPRPARAAPRARTGAAARSAPRPRPRLRLGLPPSPPPARLRSAPRGHPLPRQVRKVPTPPPRRRRRRPSHLPLAPPVAMR